MEAECDAAVGLKTVTNFAKPPTTRPTLQTNLALVVEAQQAWIGDAASVPWHKVIFKIIDVGSARVQIQKKTPFLLSEMFLADLQPMKLRSRVPAPHGAVTGTSQKRPSSLKQTCSGPSRVQLKQDVTGW